MWRVRLKNFLRRSAIYHYVLEVKLKNFYERYRTKFIPVDPKSDALFKEQQQNDPEAVFRAAIEDLGSLAIARGSRLILLYLPTVDDLGTTNSTVLKVKREVAQKLRIPLVDMTADVQAEGKGLYLEADPVHFNARGNELIARRLAETVNSFSAR